jgi:hypothetical protein
MRASSLLIVVVVAGLAVAAYFFGGDILDFFIPPPPPDIIAINDAVDSAFVEIDPQDLSATIVELKDCCITRDRLVLGRGASALRANLEITRAVERAGGTIAYGVESIDRKRRWQTVTLGVSAGDSLIREVLLVSRVR